MAKPLKTYSHLAGLKKIPSEYQIVTTDLLYYLNKGFEIDVPIKSWYEKYQTGSAFFVGNLSDFTDPRQFTYDSYIKHKHEQDIYIQTLLDQENDAAYDKKLTKDWIAFEQEILSVLRFPLHGLQMIAAYIGQ